MSKEDDDALHEFYDGIRGEARQYAEILADLDEALATPPELTAPITIMKGCSVGWTDALHLDQLFFGQSFERVGLTVTGRVSPRVVIIDSVPSKAYDAIHAAFIAADITVVDYEETLDMVLRPPFDIRERLQFTFDPNEPPTDGAKAVQHLRSRKRLRW